MQAGLGAVVGARGVVRVALGALAGLAGIALLVAAFLPEPAPPPPDPAAAARAARAAGVERLGRLWYSTPVERLFPAELRLDDGEPPSTFTRLGVAPEAACPAVLDPALLAAVQAGCTRVLRATYVDATRAVVATAGIVVLDRPLRDEPRVAGVDSGDVLLMRAYGVRGTDAARFSDRRRISSATATLVGEPDAPYLLTVVVGAADGRPPARLPRAFDSERGRRADRAEWRRSGERLLVGLKDALYDAVRAATPKVPSPAPPEVAP